MKTNFVHKGITQTFEKDLDQSEHEIGYENIFANKA